jgi:hypothetical protein
LAQKRQTAIGAMSPEVEAACQLAALGRHEDQEQF